MTDSKKTDSIKELEGKNVAYYTVVLQTIIQSEIEAIKVVITLSSIAIGLLASVNLSSYKFPVWSLILQGSCYLSFAVAVISGVGFHLSSSKRYTEELRNEHTQNIADAIDSFKTKKLVALWAFTL